jgi:hypothetical protein
VLSIDPNNQHIIGPGWFESAELKEEITPLPTEFNTLLEEEHILKTEVRESRFNTSAVINRFSSGPSPQSCCLLSTESYDMLYTARQSSVVWILPRIALFAVSDSELLP